MKLFPTSVISQIDQYTIEHEPVADIDLMERAAKTVLDYLVYKTNFSGRIFFFCGPGNNGGDGLALARMISKYKERFYPEVYLFNFGRSLSSSSQKNKERLAGVENLKVLFWEEGTPFPVIPTDSFVIDALFGSGLNRPLSGQAAELVKYINQSGATVLSVDIPSGLMGEDNRNNVKENIIRATTTLTFQFPKISFLFAENHIYTGDWVVLDIGLHPEAIKNTPSVFHFIGADEIKGRLKKRDKFSHKGTYGHALLISGSSGRMGAAVLASKACLRSGAGLLTAHVPHGAYPVIQSAVPEVMCSIDDSDLMFTGINNPNQYSAVGIGPALGLKVNTQKGFQRLIEEIAVPFVADADAINILGQHRECIKLLPANTIITPHPREFDRIAGESGTGYERYLKAVELSKEQNIYVVLKGAHTIIACPNGEVWFNSTGNPGMATAGSGDTLTGIILGLLSQGYSAYDSSLIGVYIHGLAGDMAKQQLGEMSLIASDIINNLGAAFKITGS